MLPETLSAKSGENRSFSFVFVSSSVPELICAAFRRRSLTVIALPAFEVLDAPVASHPDMLIFPLQHTLLTHEDYYRENCGLLGPFPIETTSELISGTYPQDVLFNALEMRCGIFCREKSISERIRRCGKKIINVAQGYSRCAACKVDSEALITADPSIAAAARENGIQVLEITEGNISLPGYSCGFIGGCSVRIGNEMLFTGDITNHPDYPAITAFLHKHGCKPVCLSENVLTDYGGFILA